MPAKTPTLADIEALARGAGAILRQHFGQNHTLTNKPGTEILTEADLASEGYLLEAIDERFPGHRILSEEGDGVRGQGEGIWYIDPLDGTTNFAHGIPMFAVSIAYGVEGCMQLGAVYNPVADEMYMAERGSGAWLNGERLHTSSAGELSESILVTGFPYQKDVPEISNIEEFNRFVRAAGAVRRMGAAALDLCSVAQGRLDGYWELYLELWDVAAGALIAEEAGAVVTNRHGSSDYLVDPVSVVTANPALHAQMLAVINGKS